MAAEEATVSNAANNWADMVEDVDADLEADETPVGERPETKVLKDGTRVVTEKIYRDGGWWKVTKYLKDTKRTRRVYKSAEERQKNWVRFGKAAGQGNSAELTVISEPVRLELGKKEELKRNKIETEIQNMVRKVTCTIASGGSGAYVPPDKKSSDAAPGKEDEQKKYVAPGRGAGESADSSSRPQRDDSCTVRITNLSEDISEDDLRHLFSKYGQITRSYVAVDKVTKERRGFAFITFRVRDDAAAAIQGLDRHPFNHVILNVGWAKPPAQKPQ